jgi:competence protein ComEA
MKKLLRDYFTFNSRQRKGLFVLLSIICIEIIYLQISPYWHQQQQQDYAMFHNQALAFEKQIDSLKREEVKNKTDFKTHKYQIPTPVQATEITYFNFDPNQLPDEDWIKLGLNQKQISSIKKYEAKGGKFRKKEDFKKMYCIDNNLYNKLESYIQIKSENEQKDEKTVYTQTEKIIKKVELNSADSITLLTIKGVGPFYAKSILKNVKLLGGYYEEAQLLELWKMDSAKYMQMLPYIEIDKSLIKKININTCTAQELKHPYLKWNMVNAIINYRTQHGLFKQIEEIKKTDLIDDTTYRKISPYLTTQ